MFGARNKRRPDVNTSLPAHLCAVHLGCSAAPGIVSLPANSIAVPLPWSQHTVKNKKISGLWHAALVILANFPMVGEYLAFPQMNRSIAWKRII